MVDVAEAWMYDLRRGSNHDPRDGACLMSAANWIVYGEIGDDPRCACPVIRSYAISLNDHLPDEQRQRLKPFILRVIDNADASNEWARKAYITRRVFGTILPDAFMMLGLPDDAAALRRAFSEGAEEFYGIATRTNAPGSAGLAIARAAQAAAAAGHETIRQQVYDDAIDTLDCVLGIGKQADPFDERAVGLAFAAFKRAREAKSGNAVKIA